MSDTSDANEESNVAPRRSFSRTKPSDGITFEMLFAFDNKITMLGARIEALVASLTQHSRTDSDHEVRLRALEAGLLRLESSSSTSRGITKEVWYVGLSALTLVTTIASTLVFAFHR